MPGCGAAAWLRNANGNAELSARCVPARGGILIPENRYRKPKRKNLKQIYRMTVGEEEFFSQQDSTLRLLIYPNREMPKIIYHAENKIYGFTSVEYLPTLPYYRPDYT